MKKSSENAKNKNFKEGMEKGKILVTIPGWIQGVEDEKVRMAILTEFMGDMFEREEDELKSVGYFAERYSYLSEDQIDAMIQIMVEQGALIPRRKRRMKKWMEEMLAVIREVSEEEYQKLMMNDTQIIEEILGDIRRGYKTPEELKRGFMEVSGRKGFYQPEARKETVRLKGLTIRYDLTEFVDDLGAVKAFMEAIRDFCEVTKDKRVKKVLKKEGEVPVSEILKALSGEKVWYYTTDGEMPLYHQVVSKYMFDAGYFMNYMIMIFRCEGIFNLRLDTVKFALVCWNWLEAIYTEKIFSVVADEYGRVSLRESAVEEEAVRRQFIKKVIEIEKDTAIDDEIEKRIVNPERNVFFEENRNWRPGSVGFSLKEEE